MSSILDGAKPIAWEWPDGSQIKSWFKDEKTNEVEWIAYDINRTSLHTVTEMSEYTMITSDDWLSFDTPEAAAQALADIGQGPASLAHNKRIFE